MISPRLHRKLTSLSTSATLGLGLITSSSNLQALDDFSVMSVGAFKTSVFVQANSSGAPTPAAKPASFLAKMQPLMADWVKNPAVTPPGGTAKPLTANAEGLLVYQAEFDSVASMNAALPAGDYTFTYNGQTGAASSVMVGLPAATPPTAPNILNFDAAQTVDPDTDFVLSFSPFSSAGGDDAVEVAILDETGNQVDGQSGLPEMGTASEVFNSYTINSGTLQKGKKYTGVIRFHRVTTSSLLGFPGKLAGLVAETRFSMATGGGSSSDVTPPSLTSSEPANGATGVTITFTAPITFVFNEPMQENQDILWGNASGVKWIYQWSDETTLMCVAMGTLPSGTTITWKLNPTPGSPKFMDLAGNALATTSGQFTMAGTIVTNDPCHTDTNTTAGAAVGISKSVYYLQTAPSTLTVDSTNTPAFFASASGNNMDANFGYVKLPSGTQLAFEWQSFPGVGSFGMIESNFTSQTSLDTAFPAGNYQMTVKVSGVQNTATAPMGSAPSTPRVTNYEAAQKVDANADFTLTWTPFSDATGGDVTMLSIHHGTDNFFAPDECHGIHLARNAGSFTIPKGTLKTGLVYDAELMFSHVVATNVTLQPSGEFAWAAYQVNTRFTINTGGGSSQLTPSKITSIDVTQSGQINLQLTCTSGHPLVIESSIDLTSWKTEYTTTATSSPMAVSFKPATPNNILYLRARQN
jgi:hypothetical protein